MIFVLILKKERFLGYLGHLDAGKTTLIQILIGQYIPDSGHTFILGKDSLKLAKEDYTQIGLVLDKDGLYDRLSCYDNLQLYASIYQLDSQKIESVLKQVQLYDDRKKAVNNCQKG